MPTDRFNRAVTLTEAFGIQEIDGQRSIGVNTPGCPHCGTITHKPLGGAHGGTLYHPGVECCPARIQEEITWRQAELARVNKCIADDAKAVQAIRDSFDLAHPNARKALEARLERAERVQRERLAKIETDEIGPLEAAVRRLTAKRERMLRQAPA